MLWLMLTTMIVTDSVPGQPAPLAAGSAMGPRTVLSAPSEPGAGPRLVRTLPVCAPPLQRIDDRYEAAPAGRERVRLHYAFQLQAAGCPIPVIAREIVPEADRAIEMNRFVAR